MARSSSLLGSFGTLAAFVIATSLAGCSDAASSFGSLPNADTLAARDSDTADWRMPRRIDHPVRCRPTDDPGAPATPGAAPSVAPAATASAVSSPAATPPSLGSPVPTPAATKSAAPSASPAATVQPTATPKSAPVLLPYDPPAGTYPLFPQSVFRQPLPANPTVNPNTAAWLATVGKVEIDQVMQFAANPAGLANDYSYPIYTMDPLAKGSVPVTVHCSEPWGTCNAEGKIVYVDPRELPEDGGAPDEDSHMALIDAIGGREYDFWGTQWPPKNGVLTIAWGGSCSLAGDGFDGCNASATSTPETLGVIRVSDLFAAMASPTGSLPFALQTAVKCTNGYVAPAIGGDGHTPGCPPEGSRVYLAMHDADVNASSESSIAKALLRTMDEDHYGMIITDRNGGQDGFGLQGESDLTYTAFGYPGPLVNQLLPEALREGIPGAAAPYKNDWYLQIPFDGVDVADKLKFL